MASLLVHLLIMLVSGRGMQPAGHHSKVLGLLLFAIDQAFDDELGKLFIKTWGDPTSVQLGLKDNYENALHTKGFTNPRDHDQWRVYDAIVNLYNDKIGRITLPTAQCRW